MCTTPLAQKFPFLKKMLWWESQAVFWASWRGRREETVRNSSSDKGKEEGEVVVFVDDGSRWGHWFTAQADLAGNAVALANEAWRSGGTVFWNSPKSKMEMFPLMDLIGVRMLGPKKYLPFPFGFSAGVQNAVPHYQDDAIATNAGSAATEGELFFAMTKEESSSSEGEEEEEEEEGQSQLRKRKRQTIKKAQARQESAKPLKYNDVDGHSELIKEVAAADPAYGLFPVGYLEAADEVDDLAPILDL